MPDDNTTNLPILDDIIKPGNTETDSDPAVAEHAVIPELSTDTNEELQIDDEQAQKEVPVVAAEAHQPSIDLPDIDTLTEEILGSIMFELEQVLREKIQQTLRKQLSGKTESD